MSDSRNDLHDNSPSSFWKPINWGWKYMNYLIVSVALIVGFCVWVLPNTWADPEVAANFAKQVELQKRIKAYNAEKARIAAEQEELGLVYIEPGTNPFLPPPSMRDDKKADK